MMSWRFMNIIFMIFIFLFTASCKQKSEYSKIASSNQQVGQTSIQSIIIKPAENYNQSRLSRFFINELAQIAGTSLIYSHPISGRAHVIKTRNPISTNHVNNICRKLTAYHKIQYAEPDRIMSIQ